MLKLKSLTAYLLGGALIAGAMTGCGYTPESNNTSDTSISDAAGTTGSGDTTSGDTQSSGSANTAPIRHISSKIEIDSQLKAFAESYKESTGQEIIVESLGGGVDIDAQVKNYYVAGNMPDVFPMGYGSLETFKDVYYDLSNEEWLKDTDLCLYNDEGQLVGIPYTTEGLGLVYNKTLLDQAGISPDSLNSLSGQKAAFEKLESMKDELGIRAVISTAAEPSQMYWCVGNHILSAYYSLGLDYDDHTYADMMLEGKIDEERMGKFADYLKLLFQYSDQQVLISGTYEDQTALWMTGQAVFIAGQGNWLDPEMPKYGVEFESGIAPLAFLEEETPGVTVASPSYWGVYKDSENLEATLAYLKEITTGEKGQQALIAEANCISPFKSATILPSGELSVDIVEKMKGESYNWDWTKMPSGMCVTAIAPIVDLYAKNQITRDEFVSMMSSALADFTAQNPS